MFGKFLCRTFVGLLVGWVFIAAGGAGDKAMQTLVLFVICTAGLGLIVVIPIAYFIGLFCTIWFIPIDDKSTNSENHLSEPISKYPSREALEKFVGAALKQNRDRHAVYAECRGAGWSKELVDAAFEAFDQRNQPGNPY